MYYIIIQPKNLIIFFFVIFTINILRAVKSKLFLVFLNQCYEIIKKIIFLLLVCLWYNYNKQNFCIKKNIIFIEKFHDKLLIFSYVSSFKKYAFYNIISGFIFYLVNYCVKFKIIMYIYTLNLLFVFFFLICLSLKLCLNNKTIKLLLYLLLWVNIFIIIFIFIKIINELFVFIITKLINIKDRLKNNFNPNNKDPKKPNFNFSSSDLKKKRKKTKKILQERSEEMRVKLLIQQKRHNMTKSNMDLSKKNSLSLKRGINKAIHIEPRQNIDLETQFERIKSELDAYNIQEKKFKAWSKGRGDDFTYPDESKQLFKEYSKILKGLRPHLKSMKKKVQKQLKK